MEGGNEGRQLVDSQLQRTKEPSYIPNFFYQLRISISQQKKEFRLSKRSKDFCRVVREVGGWPIPHILGEIGKMLT